MDKCLKCSADIFPEDRYCGQCGTAVQNEAAPVFSTQNSLKVEDVRFNLALVYFKMGKYEQALLEFEKVLKANPNDQQALEMKKKIEEAMKD